MILPCQPDRNMNENPFHILKWGIPSAQERKARSGTEGCCKQEPKIPRSARRSWHSSLLSSERDVVLHASFMCLPKVKWGASIFPLSLHKTPGKDTEACPDKDMGRGNTFFMFPALPCCCRYWNFNPAVGCCGLEGTGVGICEQLLLLLHLLLYSNNEWGTHSHQETQTCAQLEWYQFHRSFSHLYFFSNLHKGQHKSYVCTFQHHDCICHIRKHWYLKQYNQIENILNPFGQQ